MSDYQYQYLKNFKGNTQQSTDMSVALDAELAKLRDKKGAFWTSLVEAATISKMATVQLNEQQRNIAAMNVGKLLHAVIVDKYGESSVGDKLHELMKDAELVVTAIIDAAGIKQ